MKDKKFQPGQIWLYKTRPDEQGSWITILRVESLPELGIIVHVRVDNIRLRNCRGGPEPDKVEHMPFIKAAMERSVTKLLGKTEVPDLGGYEQWLAECGGVYSITVGEAIQIDEITFNKGLGCPSVEKGVINEPFAFL